MATQEQYRILVTIDGNNLASADIEKVNRDLGKMDDSVKKSGASWGKFKDAVGTALGAVGIAAGVAAVVGQVNELGRAANAAEITFNQVSGGADKAAASLGRMRDLTGNVIDDMALMQGANSLLVTGVASTSRQAEELVNLGSRLSAVMGVDAAEGIQNLNSALLNNSFLRLDTLGISASRVRERVNELKDAGLDMSEAFAQAVTEIGTQTLEDLGAAANVSENAIARLTTRLENLGQDVGQAVNTQLGSIATTLEQIIVLGALATNQDTGIAEIDAQIAKTEELTARTNELIQAREIAMSESGVSVGSFLIGDVSNQKFMDYAAANPELMNADGSFGALSSNIASGSFFTDAVSGDSADIAEARRILEELVGFELSNVPTEQLRALAIEADIAFSSIDDAQNEMNQATQDTTRSFERQAQAVSIASGILSNASIAIEQSAKNMAKAEDASAWMREGVTGFTVDKNAKGASSGGWTMGGMDVQTDTLSRYVAMQEEAANGLSRMSNEADLLNGIFAQGKQITEDLVYFSPTQLGLIEDRASNLTSEYERLLQIQETNPELVSQEEVDRAKEIAASAESMAQDAQAMADAWANASLSQIAGQTDGGRENEFNQMVLAGIEDPEQRAALERQMNLNSGVENANTDVLAYGAELTQAVADERGIAAGAEASETFLLAFEQGLMMGLSGEALKSYIEGEVGYALSGEVGSSGAEITVQQGEGYIALAERTGIAREDLEAATGGGMLQVGQVITLPDGSSLIAIGENASPQDIASGILGNAQTAIDGGNGISSTSVTTPNAQFSYYDPMTGMVSEDTTQASEPMVAPEEGETVSLMAEDMLAIETSMTNIAAIDTTAALEPMIADVSMVNLGISEMQTGLETLASADYSIQVPVHIVLGTQTAEMLARNPTIIETIRLVTGITE